MRSVDLTHDGGAVASDRVHDVDDLESPVGGGATGGGLGGGLEHVGAEVQLERRAGG